MEKKSEENGLTIIPASQFSALVPTGDLANAMTAMAEVGEEMRPEDLARVKSPSGGSTQWEIPTAMGVEYTDVITGALVGYQKSGVLWPSEDPVEGVSPVLRTWDLATAEQVGPIPDEMLETLEKHRIGENTYDWLNLPYNQWGTGKDNIGKRCKEQRILFVLREQDIFPLVITAGVGSLKTLVPWFNQTQNLRVAWFRLVVDLGLQRVTSKQGKPYAQIVPKVVGAVSEADGKIIYKRWTEKLVRLVKEMAVDVDIHDGE